MNDNKCTTGRSITGLLGIVFIVLKLCNVINWSWWWVLSPFWIPLAMVLIILIVYIILFCIKK